MTHRIHWTNIESGQKGIGPKLFTEEEAVKLAAELNRDYPNIEHEAVHKDWVAIGGQK